MFTYDDYVVQIISSFEYKNYFCIKAASTPKLLNGHLTSISIFFLLGLIGNVSFYVLTHNVQEPCLEKKVVTP